MERDRFAFLLTLVLPAILLLLTTTAISVTAHNLPSIVQDVQTLFAIRRR